jgi:hypothetical protein
MAYPVMTSRTNCTTIPDGVHDEGHATRRAEQYLEERVTLLSRQQAQWMLRDTDAGPYFQAIWHAQQGAILDELPARTDVSHGEAALILALHGGGEIRPERV